MANTVERFLRLPEVKALTGMSRSTIYLYISEGRFPCPVRLGARMVAWPASDVAAINSARIAGATEAEIRNLVCDLMQRRMAR